ncbi:hypothetical protein [Campylobacter sp. CCUG 57310]|uniref:hypothetical protein n=1 Tax=Campylobacter sp. CCUG 57310 TaxID=2517362 RepID=UPI00156718F6|nr:hypothetical protein [Campylobacter sp. CCUG 57310]QKF93219.1 hypothetical protein CORI_a033 [Campylobacter sp. CCUG 57310]
MSQIQDYIDALTEDFYCKFGYGAEYNDFVASLENLSDEEIKELCRKKNLIVGLEKKKVIKQVKK